MTSSERLNQWMKEKEDLLQRQMFSAPSRWKLLMEIFYPDCMFSSASLRPNTVSHSAPSLPDGPWPSQPYLHLLAGPTSFHRGGLLAGNTHLHSVRSFIFYLFVSTDMRVWKNHNRAATSGPVVLCDLPIPVWFWCLLLGPRQECLDYCFFNFKQWWNFSKWDRWSAVAPVCAFHVLPLHSSHTAKLLIVLKIYISKNTEGRVTTVRTLFLNCTRIF